MKTVTEFPSHVLVRGNAMKAGLVGEGKTPEEIKAGLGTTFQYEGDRLTHFFNSLDVAAQNSDRLLRVTTVALSEGETAPLKSVQVEAFCYVPEFRGVLSSQAQKPDAKGGWGGGGRSGRGGNNRGSGMKEGPWGPSPEQKAAKKGGGKTTTKV